MGRHKGGKNKNWTSEEKKTIILESIDEGLTFVSKKHNINSGMVSNWRKSYFENGNKVIDNKYKRGNPLSKYQKRNNLTKEEQLEYENMKLRIENELLKKGYLMKGDGTIVKFMK